MPFGFFQTLAVFVALGVGMPLGFCLLWPAPAVKQPALLTVTVLLGVLVALGLFWWSVSPLASIGVSGTTASGGTTISDFEASMRSRIVLAASGVAATMLTISALSAKLLAR